MRRTGWAKLTVEFRIRDRSSLEFGAFSVAISQNGQEIDQNLFKAFLDSLTVGLAFDLRVIRRLVGKIHARNIAKQADTCSVIQLFSVHVRILRYAGLTANPPEAFEGANFRERPIWDGLASHRSLRRALGMRDNSS